MTSSVQPLPAGVPAASTDSSLTRLRQSFRDWRSAYGLRRQWQQQIRRASSSQRTGPTLRLLVLPPDPWTLVGSKGDEAMIIGVVERIRRQSPGLVVGVVTATDAADTMARSLGFEPLRVWSRHWHLGEVTRALGQFDADTMVVVGADSIDGYYSMVTAMRMLVTADIMARSGVRTTILGFSFNSKPSPYLKPVFDGLSSGVSINVRDKVSFRRFQAFSRAKSKLVADAAFLLQPSRENPEVVAAAHWADARKAAGDVVLGFNLHPMLIRNATPAEVDALIKSAALAIGNIARERAVSVLLICHDYRGKDGDDACLGPLHAALAAQMGERLKYPTARCSASDLKAMAACTDGVVTGRMHLAIASLGCGVPVAAITYQDKFQGLFAHFDLPEHLLLSPADAASATRLQTVTERFLDELPRLREQVERALPAVKKASLDNLQGIV